MDEYSLGLYEKALPDGLSLEEKLTAASRCGFDRLELSIDESDARLARLRWSQSDFRALRSAMDRAGVPILTLCLSGHRRFPLGSPDPATRMHALELLEGSLALCAQLGIRLIQLAGYDVYYQPSTPDTRRLFEENLARCVERAAARGVNLGFETMETPFMDTVEKAMAYVKRVSSPYLGIYPDIGNLKNAALLYGRNVTQDLEVGRGHCFAAHLKETSPGVYRNLRLGAPEGHTEYAGCLRELWGQGVRMYTAEFWYDGGRDYEQEVQRAAGFLRKRISQAAREASADAGAVSGRGAS